MPIWRTALLAVKGKIMRDVQGGRWPRSGWLSFAGLMAGALPLTALSAADEPVPFPGMANHVGNIIADDYYDADRIHPRVMVERGLWTLEGAEISLDTEWSDGSITLKVADQMVIIPAPEPDSIYGAMRILDSMRSALEGLDVFEPSERRNLAYAMINGALQSLDPHTLVLPPEPADEFAEEIRGEFFGIGAYLSQQDGIVQIDRVMDGLPAHIGGVRDGDIILAVNGERTVGLSLAQAVARIKGPKGTEVVLMVERDGADGPEVHELSIIRDRIQLVTMRSYRAGSVGYVRMDEFNRKTASDLYTELLRLRAASEEPLRGFVLDMRFNSGGLLAQAKAITDFFLGGRNEIVRTVSLGRRDQISYSSAKTLLDLPMVVMVGPGSASAAEIVAGALQLNDRALVAGRTTFGKDQCKRS